MKVLFDHGPLGAHTCFANPVEVLCANRPEEVAPVLARIEALQAEGYWLAGMMSYELGYCFSDKLLPLLPETRRDPLIAFAAYHTPTVTPPLRGAAELTELVPRWSQGDHGAAFSRLAEYIRAGDCYQVNLTFPVTGRLTGRPEALYAQMAQQTPLTYGAFVDFGGVQFVSRSPELFFEVDPARNIRTRPMKGTRPRGEDHQGDQAQIADLRGSEKDRAENLMIVDLLRNDLSRVSCLGSVKVPDLFTVETYPTVHQMVSTVEARLQPGAGFSQIVEALFPCGSITGAPKIRAMQIIRELEPWARGLYCGTIGWIGPQGNMAFNVAIRTLRCEAGAVTLNVGGGIVYDSRAEAEYEEALWKSRYAGAVLRT
ncbi:aminodeoxychorismate synthase component I [Thioclava sp. GXIMD2076]|uniref:aminodeoxychorismate synthase component I n=1 Tax=Thioclava sp. GXIMD2076 TaxID=3131931 RepID=UPI0030D201B2